MADSPLFWKDRHIKYFLRCLKTLLPHQYTPNDSNRMTLGFFIVAGLDLLGFLHASLSESERRAYANWVYHCQLSSGGFRGFTGTKFGDDDQRTAANEAWDPANLPATFFALVTLLILGDDLTRVRRKECLRWLRTMQREDGSFGEVLGANGQIEGGSDLRFCCCAAGIRYMLRGKDAEYLKDVDDIDIRRLATYVEKCQSYDGGFAQAPWLEAHAGLTYCALGTLSFLDGIPKEKTGDIIPDLNIAACTPGSAEFESLIEWLAFRQTNVIQEDNESDDEEDGDTAGREELDLPASTTRRPSLAKGAAFSIEEQISSLPVLLAASHWPSEQQNCAGFNGRTNKIADTCYCFWATGSLAILNRLNVINADTNRKYLLDKTQHLIGGFGKGVDEFPDVLHSYLGLASLGLLGEPGIDPIDPVLCASQRTRQHLESLSWWKGSTSV
ncbi:geranylgeranyltransferase type I [Coccidioides immitis H538.4]|uniref:Geranylgeranyltransferase type I n=1 Tax=Coccidioides immitis H538.4 TaxID=396776 RepID=A0A0J8RX93_COCIT|nr:geranylgeranyltransferase type I [Coccidioides immitis H538.4]